MRIPTLSSLALSGAVFLAATGLAAAQTCPGDDAFEDNDDCMAPATLTAGTHSNLVVHGFANAGGLDEDYYVFSVPNGQQLTIDCLFSHAAGDIDILLYEGANCGALTSIGGSGTDNEAVTATNNTGATQDYTLEVEAYGVSFDCNDYTLVVGISGDPCAVLIPDSYEDNDDCASAVFLPAAGDTGLNVENGDEDFYKITIQPGDFVIVDVNFYHPAGDLDAELFQDLACLTSLGVSQSVTDNESVSYLNATGVALDVVLNVYGYGPGFGCNDYDVVVTVTFDPCNTLVEDALEENDDCLTATLTSEGTLSDLAVYKTDGDWFQVDLTDGETVTADCLFTHTDGDLDLFLYDTCGGAEVVTSETVDDNEQVVYTNNSGGDQSIWVEVFVWQGSTFDCNAYDLQITLDGGVAGTPMCFGDGAGVPCPCVNESAVGAGEGCQSSLGFGAILSSNGSDSVATDDISFTVTQGRPNQPSMLVQGSTLTGVPFKDGVLCMGNPTERVEVVFLDTNGVGTSSSSIITEGNVSPGDTRFYQQWFRDPGGVSPCGTGSNFTSGLVVVYVP